MEVIDVCAVADETKGLEKARYARALDLADSHFGRDRVAAEDRGFVSGSYDSLYVDFSVEGYRPVSSIEISVGKNGCTIDVHNKECFDEAQSFGQTYEERFKESVRLRHNFRQATS